MRKRNIEREKQYYLENKEIYNIRARKWSKENRERVNEKRRERYKVKKPHNRPYSYNKDTTTKSEVINYYGGKCICCDENNISFLTIDHINNDAHKEKEHRKGRLKGIFLYKWLKRNNYPLNVRVLCFNCNIGRQNNKGICPHKI